MEIWPAIDLLDGKCVRLTQGDYTQKAIYHDNPVEVVKQFVKEGAKAIHLVDLDGARDGTLANTETIVQILRTVSIPCELGGGIRSEKTIQYFLNLGLERLVLGTKAIKEPTWFSKMCQKYPGRLVLGIDAKEGLVATDGWLETSTTSAITLARGYADLPLASIVYTDISRDGMLTGPNLKAMKKMVNAVDLPVIASGGIGKLTDVTDLAETGVAGCILGKAIYENRVRLEEVIKVAREAP
ncbi:MAG: 1-(5-phosphoribosyl)-5-[(5-phosphoribosylamino)methylideneamino]imidazole-4-carboxamide isomerase [Pirellulaceae bacterium]|nr:1-(5-phosphoribosyl)-5-[(5-phosphoribosylamino)methylideneamino]imidazole-4-carboxamide isomerase [Pirellulaceae bacterium]